MPSSKKHCMLKFFEGVLRFVLCATRRDTNGKIVLKLVLLLIDASNETMLDTLK